MKDRPVILLSAYGCEPHKGSEGGVGIGRYSLPRVARSMW